MNDLVEVAADARNVFVGDARLDHVLQLVAEARFAVEDTLEGWRDQVQLKLAGTAQQAGGYGILDRVGLAQRAEILSVADLGLAVVGFVDREARHQVKIAEVKSAADLRREIHAGHERIGLKAANQVLTRIEVRLAAG